MATIKQYVVYGDNNQICIAIGRALNLGGGPMVHKEVSWYVNRDCTAEKKNPNVRVEEWNLTRWLRVARITSYPLTPIKPIKWSLYELLEPAYWSSLLQHGFRNVRAQILEIPKEARFVSLTGEVSKVSIEDALKEYRIKWRIREVEVGTYG